jgi:hypothetical protein
VLREVKLYDVQFKGKRVDPRFSSWDKIEAGASCHVTLGQGGDDLLFGGERKNYILVSRYEESI